MNLSQSSILIIIKNFQPAIVTHMIFLLHFRLEILLRKLNTTFQLRSNFMCFAPCIVIQLYHTNQQNARFYKLIFNFWCLLHVSNNVGSSSGRQLCMQYATFYLHWWEQSGGQESESRTHSPAHQTAHTDPYKTYHTAYWEWTHNVWNMYEA